MPFVIKFDSLFFVRLLCNLFGHLGFVDLVTVATMTTDPQTPCVCLCFRSQSLSVLKVSKGLLVDCYWRILFSAKIQRVN